MRWLQLLLVFVMVGAVLAVLPAGQAQLPEMTRGPIHIDGDLDFNIVNGVRSGSGTESDPYIIEDWTIVGNMPRIPGQYPGTVTIENTNAHVEIRDIEIDSKRVDQIGLYLLNVENVQVKTVGIRGAVAPINIVGSTNVAFADVHAKASSGEHGPNGPPVRGAFLVLDSSDVWLQDLELEESSETWQDGLVIEESHGVFVDGITIIDPIVGWQIHVKVTNSGPVDLNRVDFGSAGWGKFLLGDAEVALRGSWFEATPDAGGMTFAEGGTLTIQDSEFTGNPDESSYFVDVREGDLRVTGTTFRNFGSFSAIAVLDATDIMISDNHFEEGMFAVVGNADTLVMSQNRVTEVAPFVTYLEARYLEVSDLTQKGGQHSSTLMADELTMTDVSLHELIAPIDERSESILAFGNKIRLTNFSYQDNVGSAALMATATPEFYGKEIVVTNNTGVGILVKGDKITLENCDISNNSASGAFLTTDGVDPEASLKNCVVNDNGETNFYAAHDFQLSIDGPSPETLYDDNKKLGKDAPTIWAIVLLLAFLVFAARRRA